MKSKIPRRLEEITVPWLDQALKSRGVIKDSSVINVTSEQIGSDRGYMGILGRLKIDYDKPEEGVPRTMIAKLPTDVRKNRVMGDSLLVYEKEIRAYEELLSSNSLRTPRLYYTDMDKGPSPGVVKFLIRAGEKLPRFIMPLSLAGFIITALIYNRRYIILMEDLVDLELMSQSEGCPCDEGCRILNSLGRFQAEYWNHPDIQDQHWLVPLFEMPRMISMFYDRGIPVLNKHFGEYVTDEWRELIDWTKKNGEEVHRYFSTRPTTLVHGDFRLDNMFFHPETREVTVIDWQTPYRGPGVADVAYFISGSVGGEITPDVTLELLTAYHQGLVEGGVSDYTFDECMYDYQHARILGMQQNMIITGVLDMNDEDLIKLAIAIMERQIPQISDINTDELLTNKY